MKSLLDTFLEIQDADTMIIKHIVDKASTTCIEI